jgi:hypothetical protein
MLQNWDKFLKEEECKFDQLLQNWYKGGCEQLIKVWIEVQKSLEGTGKACKSMKAK